MKIVGLRDARDLKRKKDGQPMHAWMVFYTAPARGTIGEEAKMQFVDEDMFTDVLGDTGLNAVDLIGRECQMAWDNRGFLQSFAVNPKK